MSRSHSAERFVCPSLESVGADRGYSLEVRRDGAVKKATELRAAIVKEAPAAAPAGLEHQKPLC